MEEKIKEFKSWRDIHDWALENGYKNMAERMMLNNVAWNSSGEFGRNQKDICELMRFARNEDQRHQIAKQINGLCQDNLGLY